MKKWEKQNTNEHDHDLVLFCVKTMKIMQICVDLYSSFHFVPFFYKSSVGSVGGVLWIWSKNVQFFKQQNIFSVLETNWGKRL